MLARSNGCHSAIVGARASVLRSPSCMVCRYGGRSHEETLRQGDGQRGSISEVVSVEELLIQGTLEPSS